jgi:hypothetical protein
MSLNETSNLIAQSRKIIESGQDDTTNSNTLLNIILQIVTSIDTRVQRMETNIEKRIDDLNQSMLSVSSKVRTLENRSNELKAKVTECESSCQGVSNLFDQVEKQCKTNTRNIIHFDSRIKKLEEKPVVQPVIQPVVESEEIKSLKEIVLDLKCRSMKSNLIFTGLNRVQNEDTEDLLCGFLHHELEINYRIEFGNVHRFKTRSGDNRSPPIVARFLYHSDLRFVLNNANKLRGKPFGIREQFPFEIEQRRKILYPIMKDVKRTNQRVTLVRDRLYINNELYVPRTGVIPTYKDYENTTPIKSTRTEEAHHQTLPKASPNSEKPPSKRQRKGSSPKQGHTNSVRYS